MAFLMFLGYNNQAIDIMENPKKVDFTNITRSDVTTAPDKVKIEIFDNLTCKYCTDFITNTLPKIRDLEQETEDIDLRLYFIPDINDEIYYKSALSLKCAADQNNFWGMHKKLHDNKDSLNKKSFFQFAKELELNAEVHEECMDEETHKKTIENDIKYASEQNIVVKPTILINEFKLIGNQPFENIQTTINKALKQIRTTPNIPQTNTVPVSTN